MKVEVRMLEETPWLWKIFWMRAWEASKIVCLQVNAIVKPIVTTIRRRICLRNSSLKCLPPMKKLSILFIFL